MAAFLRVIITCAVYMMATASASPVNHNYTSQADTTHCACTPNTMRCCGQVIKRLINGYGSQQYHIAQHNEFFSGPGRSGLSELPYYMCNGGECTFFNVGNEQEEGNGGLTNGGNTRTRRSVVDSCCQVITSVVEVLAIVNIHDTDDTWFAFTANDTRGPTYVTRRCASPGSTCRDAKGVCETVLDIHGTLAYRAITPDELEYKYLPVTYNVGCECRSSPVR